MTTAHWIVVPTKSVNTGSIHPAVDDAVGYGWP
jgi:hypothetical protein